MSMNETVQHCSSGKQYLNRLYLYRIKIIILYHTPLHTFLGIKILHALLEL